MHTAVVHADTSLDCLRRIRVLGESLRRRPRRTRFGRFRGSQLLQHADTISGFEARFPHAGCTVGAHYLRRTVHRSRHRVALAGAQSHPRGASTAAGCKHLRHDSSASAGRVADSYLADGITRRRRGRRPASMGVPVGGVHNPDTPADVELCRCVIWLAILAACCWLMTCLLTQHS